VSIKITTTGNGRFKELNQSDYIISYGITESATPLSINDTTGEIPSLEVEGEKNETNLYGTVRPNSLLMVDNEIKIVDSNRGEFTGKVNSLSMNSETVSISALSIFEKLNTQKIMSPFNGTLSGAFAYYFAQAGIGSGSYSIDSSFNSVNLVLPGWTDTIWSGLKSLCAVVRAEIYFDKTIVRVKPIGTKSFSVPNSASVNYSLTMGQRSKQISLTNTNASWVEDAVVFAYKPGDSAESIDYNETKEVILDSKVSLQSINQPEYSQTAPASYSEFTGPDNIGTVPSSAANGFYAFRNSRGLIVAPAVAESVGAGIKVEVGETPEQIKMTITGPNKKLSTPWSLEYTENNPALGLTGTGAFLDKKVETFNTGSEIGDEINDFTDNPFLVNKAYLYNAAFYASQNIAGPIVTLSFDTDKIEEANNQEFGFLPGALFSYGDSKFRVVSASYSYGTISVSAVQHVTFADFNSTWSGKTYAQFNAVMQTPAQSDEYMKYSDLAILPLMEE
jgi:hypothetical protein